MRRPCTSVVNGSRLLLLKFILLLLMSSIQLINAGFETKKDMKPATVVLVLRNRQHF
jgi:hypothetical protein